MKKASEALGKAQEQAAVRRQLLESGKIRLIRETPKRRPHQKDEGAEVRKQDSK
jgi:hypothetical protein